MVQTLQAWMPDKHYTSCFKDQSDKCETSNLSLQLLHSGVVFLQAFSDIFFTHSSTLLHPWTSALCSFDQFLLRSCQTISNSWLYLQNTQELTLWCSPFTTKEDLNLQLCVVIIELKGSIWQMSSRLTKY